MSKVGAISWDRYGAFDDPDALAGLIEELTGVPMYATVVDDEDETVLVLSLAPLDDGDAQCIADADAEISETVFEWPRGRAQ
jgi:hypothetical protein